MIKVPKAPKNPVVPKEIVKGANENPTPQLPQNLLLTPQKRITRKIKLLPKTTYQKTGWPMIVMMKSLNTFGETLLRDVLLFYQYSHHSLEKG